MNQSAFVSPHSTGLLANRYQLKQLIGRGGMGEVFLAEDVLLGGIPVAIKFLSQTFVNHKMQKDFEREARTSAALSQKSIHIVRAYDYGVSEEGKPFYVMEYLNGRSLKDLIPMPLPKFLTLARQICLGLQCAHQGINIDGKIYLLVHRDIKPANILVIPDPILGQLVKILDFGIAKFLNYAATISTNKGFNGTLPYSSPEQLEGGDLDSRSDIYSLGVMMFEMLTGAKPWKPETDLFGAWYKAHHFEPPRAIADINPQLKIPKQLNDLIVACLAKSASDRPQNITVILQILNSLEQSNCPIPTTFSSRPTSSIPLGSGLPLAVEQACWQVVWPQDKPIQEIVFPQLLDTTQGTIATLWLMLPKQEIKKRSLSQRYNQFIFVTSPHPMLLWVTVLYNRELGPKWLPCYLDMQNPQVQRLVYSLAENERYPLICFTLEAPHSCANVLSSPIDPTQRQMLKVWVEQSKNLPHSSQPQLSKQLLKQQYKQLQSRILRHLASKLKFVVSGSI
ncbi:serine/threonine protein kinase [Nostoc minutum NIES-26]|uniref:Serine/threonine protein kinase n=1 Tax=Nostoc minutum NIES-26 TaxID=1844469 RepID=A0A367QU12_9NOSO|nr:serine/threonine-protein kinase [Dendronalium sp. ChiSLP03b]MDZ8205024.1 serine/threonine-protein kinase [Dendronalium sp. ChiSLP03b]RCJ27656.1 serine/threonine protein kinase [Nostoc minutum NIES-26]